MTENETAGMFDFIESANPQFNSGLSTEKKVAAIETWAEMLAGYTLGSCMTAVKAFMSESPYPPKISDIITRIRGAAQTSGQGKWLVTEWEIRSLKNLCENLGIKPPLEILTLLAQRVQSS